MSTTASADPDVHPHHRILQRAQRPRLVGRQVWYEQLSFWLNPLGAFFTLGFSVIFLVLLGAIAGQLQDRLGVRQTVKLIQYYLASFTAYAIMAACFTVLASTLVNRREMGLLKRLRLSPVPTWSLLSAIFLSTMLVALSAGGDPAGGGDARLRRLPPGTRPGLHRDHRGRDVQLHRAGDRDEHPGPQCGRGRADDQHRVLPSRWRSPGCTSRSSPGSTLANISGYFPVRHLINATLASFNLPPGANPWAWHDLGVMAIWGVGGVIVALRRWRWAPRRG